ncbi:MAG: hypothetical protein ABIT37_22390 [Luteolibacter sp.]
MAATEPIQTEASEFHWGDEDFELIENGAFETICPLPNHRAIHTYLNSISADDVARRAAAMIAVNDEIDPGKLVDAAIAIQADAEKKVELRRQRIVEKMGEATLSRLADELGIGDYKSKSGEEHKKMLCDPFVGPVLQRLLDAPPPKEERSPDEATVVSETRKFTDYWDFMNDLHKEGDYPKPPYSMEAVIRHIFDEFVMPWSVVEGAFKDALSMFPNSDQSIVDKNDIIHGKKLLAIYTHNIEKLLPNAPNLQFFENEIQGINHNLKRLRKNQSDREFWKPGGKIPNAMVADMEKDFAYRWPDLKDLKARGIYEIIHTDFRGFWAQHRDAYVEIKLAKKEVDAKRRAGGEVGRKINELNRWRGRTIKFAEFLRETSNGAPCDLSEKARQFATKHSDAKKANKQNEIAQFLGTLCTFALRENDRPPGSEILKRLQAPYGDRKVFLFKNMGEETVVYCLNLLRTSLAELKATSTQPPLKDGKSVTSRKPSTKKNPAI